MLRRQPQASYRGQYRKKALTHYAVSRKFVDISGCTDCIEKWRYRSLMQAARSEAGHLASMAAGFNVFRYEFLIRSLADSGICHLAAHHNRSRESDALHDDPDKFTVDLGHTRQAFPLPSHESLIETENIAVA